MKECPAGSNSYCCGKCECETGPLVFVDPLTGALGYVADKPQGVSPIWWAGTNSTVLLMSSTSSRVASSSATASSLASSTAVTSTATPSSTNASGTTTSSSGLSPRASAG